MPAVPFVPASTFVPPIAFVPPAAVMPAVARGHAAALHVQAAGQRVPVPVLIAVAARPAVLHCAVVVDGFQSAVVAVVFVPVRRAQLAAFQLLAARLPCLAQVGIAELAQRRAVADLPAQRVVAPGLAQAADAALGRAAQRVVLGAQRVALARHRLFGHAVRARAAHCVVAVVVAARAVRDAADARVCAVVAVAHARGRIRRAAVVQLGDAVIHRVAERLALAQCVRDALQAAGGGLIGQRVALAVRIRLADHAALDVALPGGHVAGGVGQRLQLAVRVVAVLDAAAQRVRHLHQAARAVVGVARDAAQTVRRAGKVELVPGLAARGAVGVLGQGQAVQCVVLVLDRTALGIGLAGNAADGVVGVARRGLAVGVDHALQEAVGIVLPARGLAQRVGLAGLLAGGVVRVRRQLAGGIAVGQRFVLVVVGVLGEEVGAPAVDLLDAQHVDAVVGIVIQRLAAHRIALGGDVALGVVAGAHQLGTAVVQHTRDRRGLFGGADARRERLIGVGVPDPVLQRRFGALDRTRRHVDVVGVQPVRDARLRVIVRRLRVGIGIPVERIAVIDERVEHAHPARRLRFRVGKARSLVPVLHPLGLALRVGDVDPALHTVLAIGELRRAVRRGQCVDEGARVIAEAGLHADRVGDVAQPAAGVIAEASRAPERVGDLRDQRAVARVAVGERGALAGGIGDGGQALLAVVAERDSVAFAIDDLREEHPARVERCAIGLCVDFLAAILQAALVAGGGGAHQDGQVLRVRAEGAAVVAAREHGAAARDVAHHVGTGAARVVLDEREPVEGPLRTEIGIGEVGRLVGLALVIGQREPDGRALGRTVADRRVDQVQADQHRMHVVARHADVLHAGVGIASAGGALALGFAVACLGIVGRGACVVHRGGRAHAHDLLGLGQSDLAPAGLLGRLLGDDEVVAGLRLQRVLADPKIAAEGRILEVIAPAFLADDRGVVVDLPVHHGRQRNRRARCAARNGVRQLDPLRQFTDRLQRDAMRARAHGVQRGDARRVRTLRLQDALERHRTAQVGHAMVVAHHPQTFAGAGHGFGGRPLQRTILRFLEQRLHPVGMAQPRMHAQQLTQGAVGQALGLRLRQRTRFAPRRFPRIDGAREVAQLVVRQAQVGAQRQAPWAVGVGVQKGLQRRDMLGTAAGAVLLQGLPERLLLFRAARPRGHQGLFEQLGCPDLRLQPGDIGGLGGGSQ